MVVVGGTVITSVFNAMAKVMEEIASFTALKSFHYLRISERANAAIKERR